MFSYDTFCRNISPILEMIIKQSYRETLEYTATHFIEPNPNAVNQMMYERFFALCDEHKEELARIGIRVYFDSKKLLYDGANGFVLRFGKMNDDCLLKKCNTDIDKKFASQNLSLFPELAAVKNLHIGYIVGKDGITIDDIVFAIPASKESNSMVWRISESKQTYMEIELPQSSSNGNGFLDGLKKGIASRREEHAE